MRNGKANWPLRLLAFVLALVLAPVWLPLVIVFLLLLAIGIPLSYSLVYGFVWSVWGFRDKDTLFVYSDSPIWRDYMLSEILPLVERRAVVLNWSERSKWKRWSLPVLAFRFFGGQKAFNPLVLVFRPFRRVQKYRFWPAFREWKQGNKRALEELKLKLAEDTRRTSVEARG